MSALRAGGIGLQVPRGWDAELRGQPAPRRGEGMVVHAANFALPPDRGDFGSGAVERMGPHHVLVCLLEYGTDDARTELFRQRGIPRLSAADFSPSTMQRTIAGMAGAQAFFNESGRAFCLYAVVGSWRGRGPLVPQANDLLAGMCIDSFPVS